jgi:hypothetical protein
MDSAAFTCSCALLPFFKGNHPQETRGQLTNKANVCENLVIIYQQVTFVECFANHVFHMNEKCRVDSSWVQRPNSWAKSRQKS